MERKRSNGLYIGAAIAAILAVASYWLYPASPEKLTPMNSKTYESARYGIAFQYPPKYRLSQRDESGPDGEHHVITLIDESFFPLPENGEGPTGITVDIFENDRKSLSSEDFIRTVRASKYELGDGVLATTSYGGVTGLEYGWSGLYQGRSLVVARPGYVFMFSATHDKPDEATISDFSRIVEAVVLK